MKTKTLKNQGLKVLFAGMLIAHVSSSAIASPFSEGTGAVQLSITHAANPFTQGTGEKRLDPEVRDTLLQYAESAYNQLRNARARSTGKSFADANEDYINVIMNVVVESYKKHGATELLMRHVLNQALELTVGVPDAKSQVTGGILKNTVNQELLTIILEDSMDLALTLHDFDITAIQQGTEPTRASVMMTAGKRLKLASKWSSSIFEQDVLFDFQKATIQQFLNTAATKQNLYQAVFAESIIRADNVVRDFSGLNGRNQSDAQLAKNIRKLRFEIYQLLQQSYY